MLIKWDANRSIHDSVLGCIGRTPMVSLKRLSAGTQTDICVKLEFPNPSGSLKDRVAYEIIRQAEERGELKPGMILLEGTTGNTGISTAMVGAACGYQVIIVMPQGMSEERKKTIQAYGAKLVLTPGAETDVDLVLEEVARLKEQYSGQVFQIGQFYREDNLKAHIDRTGPEIWEQTGGDIDAFIMCQGTGGTVTGTAKYLKSMRPDIKIFVSEPSDSPILAKGKIGHHKVQGIADGLIPEILDLQYVDGIVLVSSNDSLEMARQMARQEGIFCGTSSGCNVQAAFKVAAKYPHFKRIVTMVNDNGLRYLSTELCGTECERELLQRDYQLSAEDQQKLAQFQFEIIE